MSVDYKHKRAVFPPAIYATNERPDIVLWSESFRRAVLLELTCPAEEGIPAARTRKEEKYAELVDNINATKCWSAELFTLEIGARGLVACRTFKIFRVLGFTVSEANTLCRSLSIVSSRCSFAIHCAHTENAWIPRGLIRALPPSAPIFSTFRKPHRPPSLPRSLPQIVSSPETAEANLHFLCRNGVTRLYHFTDRSCLPSIATFGLLSWVGLEKACIFGKKGSSELSRALDESKGLGDFVRLSFSPKHPMMFVALKEGRLVDPVVLEVNLGIVLTSGTLFSDRNAAASTALVTDNPSHIRFDVALCSNHFSVSRANRHFFQAEVLIPSKIPPCFIMFSDSSTPRSFISNIFQDRLGGGQLEVTASSGLHTEMTVSSDLSLEVTASSDFKWQEVTASSGLHPEVTASSDLSLEVPASSGFKCREVTASSGLLPEVTASSDLSPVFSVCTSLTGPNATLSITREQAKPTLATAPPSVRKRLMHVWPFTVRPDWPLSAWYVDPAIMPGVVSPYIPIPPPSTSVDTSTAD